MLETQGKHKVARGDSWTAVALSKNSPFQCSAFRLFVCSTSNCLIIRVNTYLIRAYRGGRRGEERRVGRGEREARRGSPPAGVAVIGVGGARSTHPSGWEEGRGGPTADARGVGGRGLLAPAARGHRARRHKEREGREGGGGMRGRWAHASPRAGEAHALGARGGRAPWF